MLFFRFRVPSIDAKDPACTRYNAGHLSNCVIHIPYTCLPLSLLPASGGCGTAPEKRNRDATFL